MSRTNSTDEFFKEDNSSPTDIPTKLSPFTIWAQPDANLLSLYQLHHQWTSDSEKGPRLNRIIQFYLRSRLFLSVICFATAVLYFLFNCGVPTSSNVVMSGFASIIIFYGLWMMIKVLLLYVPPIVFGKMKFDGSQPTLITILLSFSCSEEIQVYHLQRV